MSDEIVTELYELCVDKLSTFKYLVSEEEIVFLTFIIKNNIQYIFDNCNITELDESLYYRIVNKSCGDFLFQMNGVGKLPSDFDFSACFKKLVEGDVTVEFDYADASMSDESRFNMLIKYLFDDFSKNLSKYRKIVW